MASNTFSFTVTSSLNSFENYRRFPGDIVIEQLKQKLEMVTGVPFGSMTLQLLKKNKELVEGSMSNDKLLNSYPIEDDMFLHVIDNAPQNNVVLEDLSSVPKYEISDEKYSKRDNTFRAFKQKNQLDSPGDELSRKMEQELKLKEEEKRVQKFQVGDRCKVCVVGQPERKGTVMYLGTTEFKPGHWVGVKYDEPLGKNDGTVQGKRYFECGPKYGGFVKPQDVTIDTTPVETDINEI